MLLVRRIIFDNSVNSENPGHSVPHGLTLSDSLTKEFQAAGGAENGPEDDFCRPGYVENVATPSDC